MIFRTPVLFPAKGQVHPAPRSTKPSGPDFPLTQPLRSYSWWVQLMQVVVQYAATPPLPDRGLGPHDPPVQVPGTGFRLLYVDSFVLLQLLEKLNCSLRGPEDIC